MTSVVSLAESLAHINEFWSPQVVGALNGQHVKLAKVCGEFVWHRHEDEDELFLVVKGSLLIRLKGHEVTVKEGEFFIVPRGADHQPVAEEEAHILLFEPETTRRLGDKEGKAAPACA